MPADTDSKSDQSASNAEGEQRSQWRFRRPPGDALHLPVCEHERGGRRGGYYRTLTNGDLLYFFTAMLLKRSRHRSDEPQKIKTTFLIKVSVFPLLQTDIFDKYLIYTVL